MLRKVTTVIAALLIAVAPGAHAQSSRPQFEVASIKSNKSTAPGFALDANKGRFKAANFTVKVLLRYAFDRRLPEDETRRGTELYSGTAGLQVYGGPAWIDSDRFDVEAKPPADHPVSQTEMQSMVQSLLEDRFQLKAHYEMRELPIYNLIVAKEGRMQLSPDQSSSSADGEQKTIAGVSIRRGTFTLVTPGYPNASNTMLHMIANAVPMSTVATMLESFIARPVFDKTGLGGLFDIDIPFGPGVRSGPSAASNDETPRSPDPQGPSLFTALQEQLGLKLESAKRPVEVLVIDSVQKPSEN